MWYFVLHSITGESFVQIGLDFVCNLPKTTQKQPKILLFAGTTNFENI